MEELNERESSQSERFRRDPANPSANTVYLQVKSEQVKGLLGSKYAVPQGFVGLIKEKGGGTKVLMPGEESGGEFTAHLVRDREVRIPFQNSEATTSDGYDASASFELSVTPDVTRRDALESFIERGAEGRQHLDWTLLKAELHEKVNTALKEAIKEFTAEELADEATLTKVKQKVVQRCEAELSVLGIGHAEIELGRVRSQGFEKHKNDLAEVERTKERSQAQQEVQAAMLRDQMGQELSRTELEEFLASAREEGLIKEHERKLKGLERKSELDRFEKEYQQQQHSLEAALRKLLIEEKLELDGIMLEKHLEVVKTLREELDEDRVEVYINLLKDESLKADLLHRLIQRTMTPEQLSAIAEIEAQRVRQAELSISRPRLEPVREESNDSEREASASAVPSEVNVSTEDAIRREAEIDDEDVADHAASEMNVALGTSLSEAVEEATRTTEDTPTERLETTEDSIELTDEHIEQAENDAVAEIDAFALVASGRRVYAIDPLRQLNLDQPELELDYSDARLGSLRSVRVHGTGDDRVVISGARNGVYSTLIKHRRGHREYPIGMGVDARTGINATAVYKGYIYATHSEFGLLRWPLLQPYSNAVQVMPELISKYSTTRSLQLFEGRLLFANGPTVLLLEAGNESGSTLSVAARYRGTRHEVTALASDDKYILIADTAGDVYVWDPKSSEPPVLAFYAGTAISDLAAAELKGGRRSLLVAIKRTVVPMLFRDGSNALEFTAPEAVRACDVMNGTIIGLSRDRMRLFTWRESRPEWPAWQFQFIEPVLDMRLVAPRDVIGARASGPHKAREAPAASTLKKPPGYQ